ncbi:HAD family hydrolase [Ammoniphilus sp. 3BR4]|uniref:HAD family hydrolase n=1 Tax=Ammoniphilus sp. 3BR4 TaxID=3158265 RepID=UPI0034670BE9
MIRNVFFDLDDTLYDQLKPFERALQNVFSNQLYLPVEQIFKRSRFYSDLLWKDYVKNAISLDELRVQRISLALAELGYPISAEQAKTIQSEYEIQQGFLQLDSTIRDTLNGLLANDYQLGIITNGPTRHQGNKIEALGLTAIIPTSRIFISDAIGIAKPNPALFKEVEKRLGLIPGTPIYIGDSWNNDVVAPMEAGWTSIWYNHRHQVPDRASTKQPAATIDDFKKLSDTISQLNNST